MQTADDLRAMGTLQAKGLVGDTLDRLLRRLACVAYDVAGNPAASSGECEDHDELVGSQMADAGRALAATFFRFL